MKYTKSIIAGLALLIIAQSSHAQKTVKLENELDSASYALAVILANQLKQSKVDTLNYDAMVKGLVDYFEEDSLKFDMETANTIYRNYVTGLAQKEGIKNLADGQKFLAENARKDGVTTTPSGLQYKVITEGDGPMPALSDQVMVHYTGKLIDGKIFDSSVQRGQPATFGVGGVIQGWTEALQMMKVGSKWELYIPADLAYGERGNRSIPPNSVLVFEVELLAVTGDSEPPIPTPGH